MLDEWSIGKHLEADGCGLLQTLNEHFTGGTVEIHKNLSQNSRRRSRNSTLTPEHTFNPICTSFLGQ
jgi:hypothetical protein